MARIAFDPRHDAGQVDGLSFQPLEEEPFLVMKKARQAEALVAAAGRFDQGARRLAAGAQVGFAAVQDKREGSHRAPRGMNQIKRLTPIMESPAG